MATVTYQNSAEVSGTGNTATVSLPSGTQVGDLVLLILNLSSGTLQTAPAGWSQVFPGTYAKTMTAADLAAGSASFGLAGSVYNISYYAGPGQGFNGSSFGWSMGTSPAVYNLLAVNYRSSSGVAAIDVAALASVSGSPPASGSVTTTDADDQVISIIFGSTSATAPTGFTRQVNSQPAGASSIQIADAEFVSTGATGAISWSGGSQATGWTVALAPVPVAPAAPVLVAIPAADATATIDLSATYQPVNGAAMNAYALRIKVDSGSYQYYNATTQALQGTEVWNALTAAAFAEFTVALPANLLANGHTDSWSFATQESSENTQGPFAADSSFSTDPGPTLSVTGPSGTISVPNPSITWTATPASGQAQTYWRLVVYTAAQYGAGGFIPGVSQGAYDSGLQPGSASAMVPPVLLDNVTTYRAYAQITQTDGQVTAWEYEGFTVEFDFPQQPVLAVAATANPVTGQPVVILDVTGQDNLGTANQGSLEDNATTGFVALTNTDIASSNAWSSDGEYALAMTSVAAGTIGAQWEGGTSGIPVTPGEQITVWAVVRAATAARAVALGAAFYDSSGALLSDPEVASGNDSTTADLVLSGQVTVPAGAAYMAPVVEVTGCGVSETHYADQWGCFPGVVTYWSGGGMVGNVSVQVQSSTDGGLSWNDIRFGPFSSPVPLPAPSETATVTDGEAVPGLTMVYRARSILAAYGTVVTSPWSNTVSAVCSGYPRWYLSNPLVLGSGVGFDLSGNPTKKLRQVDVEYDPLGDEFGLKMWDGWKGVDWTIPVRCTNLTQEQALETLLLGADTLLLQSPLGNQWYVTPIGDVPIQFLYGTGQNPWHDVSLTLRQVAVP